MPIPKVSDESIKKAFEYIDKNGVPWRNQSYRYEVILENGNKYPPKYVLAVARHLETGEPIDIEDFNAVEAKKYFLLKKYKVNVLKQKYKLVITKDGVESDDPFFSEDDLSIGNIYKPLNVYFKGHTGIEIKRKLDKGEKKCSNQTLPRLAMQIYENQIAALSREEKISFPVCRYTPKSKTIRGIFSSVEEFNKYKNSIEYLIYNCQDGQQFVVYCWNIFSPLLFIKTCLQSFAEAGDSFVLEYKEKDEKEKDDDKPEGIDKKIIVKETKEYSNKYSKYLIESRNVIFRGAPGTGKTYLAKEIAADIISNGYSDSYDGLTDEQKKQVEFVQFHPSYDYSDFVEGLRPRINSDGSMGFELKDGIFKSFVDRARLNYENSKKTKEDIANEISVQDAIDDFLSEIEFGKTPFKTIKETIFYVMDADDEYINIFLPDNKQSELTLSISVIRKLLESGKVFKSIKDITKFFNKKNQPQHYSYDFVLYNQILSRKKKSSKIAVQQEELKKYIFIIDEINRGEISKIFGELFFAIDPGYRGKAGEVSTQYSNLHSDSDKKFYIPENLYIIGTMNDIDRSVDTFDFAMRRRFRFIEIKANENTEMLSCFEDAKKQEIIRRMEALNNEIANTEGLNENYQIGASYFLKLKYLSDAQLWTDYLKPLLQEYIQGMNDEGEIMARFAKAYGYNASNVKEDETDQN